MGPGGSFGQPLSATVRHLPVVQNADEWAYENKCGLKLSDFNGCSPSHNPELFARAPWVDLELVKDVAGCCRFAKNDKFPGRLLIIVIHKHDWKSMVLSTSDSFKFAKRKEPRAREL